jgi:small subunit ribosomal protein S6
MAKYELMVIYDPFLEEADQSALIEKTQEQVKRRGGSLANVDTWGKRRLAYPIAKKHEGYYVLFAFEAPGEGPALHELERTLRLDEKVMRVMLTRVPKPKKPAKVKAKKPRPAQQQQAGTEVQYGAGSRTETHSAGQAGAGHNQ